MSGGCELLGWIKTLLMIAIFLVSIIVFGYAVRLKREERAYAAEAATASDTITGSN